MNAHATAHTNNRRAHSTILHIAMTPSPPPSPSLRLPAVVYDNSLPYLFNALGSYATQTPPDKPLILDMQSARFYTSGALAALLATIHFWMKEKREIHLLNFDGAPAYSYWQRMDFFAQCGLSLPETFTRRNSAGRFVSLKRISSEAHGHVDRIAEEIATCLFPSQAKLDDPEQTGAFDLVVYATTELINNVLQHAHSDGFILAQVYPQQDVVRVAIADFGIGIRGSFEETKPTFWNSMLDDCDAIQLALKPEISSKTHVGSAWGMGAINAGVGLSIIKELAFDTDGIFTLASHTGFHQSNHMEQHAYPTELTLPVAFPGTLCSLQVSKSKLISNQLLLRRAKERLHLLDKTHPFDNLFEP